jgi:hypothetical protein
MAPHTPRTRVRYDGRDVGALCAKGENMRQWLAGVVVGAVVGALTAVGAMLLLWGPFISSVSAQAGDSVVPRLRVEQLELVEPLGNGEFYTWSRMESLGHLRRITLRGWNGNDIWLQTEMGEMTWLRLGNFTSPEPGTALIQAGPSGQTLRLQSAGADVLMGAGRGDDGQIGSGIGLRWPGHGLVWTAP